MAETKAVRRVKERQKVLARERSQTKKSAPTQPPTVPRFAEVRPLVAEHPSPETPSQFTTIAPLEIEEM